MDPNWLKWAKQLQAIAQNGLTYAEDPFDEERYRQVQQIAAEMMAAGSEADIGTILNLFSNEKGYATPKVDVRGVAFRNDAVLLVKEHSDGHWALPGGWADVGESPAESVAREVYEESGFEVQVRRLLAVYDRSKHAHWPPFPHHVYKMFFLCEITDGKASTGMETASVGFFRADEIPPLSVTRVTPAQIARMFEHAHHPSWPADFD
jgi:ADP-ribose pyrophosphatase YjhB (NUDIX family)